MSKFFIQAAQESDCASIVAMVEELAEYEKARSSCHATIEKMHYALFVEKTAQAFIGWQQDGQGAPQPVALAVFFTNFSTWTATKGLYLEDLYVREAARGQGYGRAMMQHLARHAVQQQCARFDWSVLAWNRPAIAFYQKLGAQILDDWRICRLTGAALDAAGTDTGSNEETK